MNKTKNTPPTEGEGRPKKGYYLADGKRVPGVTTILSRFKESGGLIHWAWKLGMEGKDYREERDAAADIGTLAHQLVQAEIRGQSPHDVALPDNEAGKPAWNAYIQYQQWAKLNNLEYFSTEVPLVSETCRCGGTPDAVCYINGELSIADWKSANSIYPENLIQLAAYKLLWEEIYPQYPIEGGFHLLRFSKDHGDFHHHRFGELDEAAEAFKLMRELYDIMNTLKKRAK